MIPFLIGDALKAALAAALLPSAWAAIKKIKG
jgi:biotin transporter BioY